MKQTAVEWFVANIDWQLLRNTKTHYNMIIEKAKAMEKEQIKNALQEFLDITLSDEVGEKYYNETFKSE